VAGRRHRLDGQRAERDLVAIGEETVELAAVGGRARLVENGAEDLLDRADLRADGGLRAGLRLEVMRRREVVGMGMGLEKPDDPRARLRRGGEQGVGALRRDPARLRVVVENGIDDRGLAARRVDHEIGDGIGRFVEKGADFRCGHRGFSFPPGFLS